MLNRRIEEYPDSVLFVMGSVKNGVFLFFIYSVKQTIVYECFILKKYQWLNWCIYCLFHTLQSFFL